MSDSLFTTSPDLNNSASHKRSPSPTSDHLRNFSKLLEDAENFKTIFKDGLQDTQQDLIKQMLDETQFFNVGNDQHPFSSNDPIFERDSPFPQSQRLESSYCQSCLQQLKSSKNHNFCDFCGHDMCKMCLNKTKPYPINNEGYKNRGNICKVCDRKFYIKDILKESLDQIEIQRQVTESLKQQAQEKKEECNEIEQDFRDFSDNIQEQLNRCNQVKKQEKKEIKKLTHQINQAENECDTLFEKQNLMQIEQDENKDNIEQLKQEINDIDENVLKTTVKIREVELERERLEEQIRELMFANKQYIRNKNISKSLAIDSTRSNKSSIVEKGRKDLFMSPDQEVEGYSNFNEILQTEDIIQTRSNRTTSQLSDYKRKRTGEDSISTLQGQHQNSCCNNSKCYIF